MNLNEQSETVSFIVIPDTQILAKTYPHILSKMSRWIVEHKAELNVQAVVHLGDVVDEGAEDEKQFQRSLHAFELIESEGCPLLIAAGNHDYDAPITSKRGPVSLEKNRALTMFNQYFGTQRFVGKDWFGEVFEDGKAENMFARIDVSGEGSFLLFVLEFVPRDEVMEWVDRIVQKYPDDKVIVITHSYMYMDGKRVHTGIKANPKLKYPAVMDGNDGEDMWQKHLRHYPNLVAVFSGHHIPENVSHRVDQGVHGNKVVQCFQNWQADADGGSGRFRIVTYDLKQHNMTLQVFNPDTEQFETGTGYELEIELG